MKEYLPSICEAAKNSSHECKVCVVDNLSTDGSVDFLRSEFPEVNIYRAEKNRILCSYNDAVQDLDSDVVIFLNNDIKVDPDFVDYLLDHFKKDDTMFVAPRVMNFDGTFNGGRSYLKFDKGVIKVMVDEEGYKLPGKTCAISCGAFKRKTFIDLGGFDDLYLPGIWEDVDICYRALKKGWKGIYEPRSVIWHAESTTFHREYGRKKKLVMAHRNMFLFFWKNIQNKTFLAKHLLITLPRVVAQAIAGKPEMMEGLFNAIPRLSLATGKRRSLKEDTGRNAIPDKALFGREWLVKE
jgi:GT2 family glycosyltransferase